MHNRKKVALITSNRISQRGWVDSETPLIEAALNDRGVPTELLNWHENPDLSPFGLAVLRSPWDLFLDNEKAFLAWLTQTEQQTTVLNSSETARKVLDKHYLNKLAATGIPTVSTDFLEVGEPLAIPDTDFVIKPVTAGGACDSARYRASDSSGEAHVSYLHAKGLAAMVQPYMSSIDTHGERALVFINDTFDHAIVKDAILTSYDSYEAVRKLHPGPRPHNATPDEQAIAAAALTVMAAPGELLSGRVDFVSDDNGNPVVLELELIAPVLFLTHDDGAVDRFAEAIQIRLHQATRGA